MNTTSLVLASTSPYRRKLLENLGLSVQTLASNTPETPIAGEKPGDRAIRLGLAKAKAVSKQLSQHSLVIGSDQVCHLGEEVYGKPGSHDKAVEQLGTFSGKWVTFTTSVAVIGADGRETVAAEAFSILFRSLSSTVIAGYLERDKPYDCAGSIKAEGLGVSLIADTRGRDINVLYGLPLMLLADQLAEFDLNLLDLAYRD